MHNDELLYQETLEFKNIDSTFFLLGLISAFENRYQAKADSFFKEISWKQFFAVICIDICKENPTIKELAAVMGSSHQNVKQILNKLEHKGYVKTILDEQDKRKQRIVLTEKAAAFRAEYNEKSKEVVKKIFNGIKEEDISTVIKTLLQMENNLKNMKQ